MITKASAIQIIVGTKKGEVIIVEHTNGKNLAVPICAQAITWERYMPLAYITIYSLRDRKVQIWDCLNHQLLDTIENSNFSTVGGVAINDDFVVVGGFAQFMHSICEMDII